MTQKVLGWAIIIGAIFGIIFCIKFIPVYVNNSELERSFQECISNFEQYKEGGCRSDFEKIIKEDGINLNPASILVNAAVYRDSVVEADYVQVIDFFGFWKYPHRFHPKATGVPPKRT